MNLLMQEVITNKEVRSQADLSVVAAQTADNYLPWSDEA